MTKILRSVADLPKKERLSKLRRRSARPQVMLLPTTSFKPKIPRLHVNGDVSVVTINGVSHGSVRHLGACLFLWSDAEDEGRVDDEEEAWFKLGFEVYYNHRGEKSLRDLRGRADKVMR